MKLPEMKALYVGVLAASVSTGAVAGVVTTDGPDIVVKTDSGFSAQTVDGAFKFDLGGRVMYDIDTYDGIFHTGGQTGLPVNGDGRTGSGTEIRRARLEMKGTAYKDWHYVLIVEMADTDQEAGGDPENVISEANIRYTGLDWATLHAGKYKAPFSLENLTSSKYIATIERNMLLDMTSADSKQQQLGISGNLASQFTWFFTLIDLESTDGDNAKDVGWGTRFTWSPVHDEGSVIHLGASFQDRSTNDSSGNTARFRTRGGVHTNGRFFSPTAILVEDEVNYGLEAAWLSGPFSVQTEYIKVERDDQTDVAGAVFGAAGEQADVEMEGWYLQGTWTLTGESRGYKWKDGKFDKIKPKGKNGAVELVARYEVADIDYSDFSLVADEVEIDVLTLGINWWANSNVALKLNYLDIDTDNFVGSGVAGFNDPGAGFDEDGRAVIGRIQYIF